MKRLLLASVMALALTTSATADVQWWRLVRSARDVLEVCNGDGMSRLVRSPAQLYEFLKAQGEKPVITENTSFNYEAGISVTTVTVTYPKDENVEWVLYWFGTAEECLAVAHDRRAKANIEERRLNKYR